MPIEVTMLTAAAAFGLSTLLTRYLCDARSVIQVLDHPNERSLHERPTPRTGGIAIVTASVVAASIAVTYAGPVGERIVWLGIGSSLLAAVSFVDDRVGLNVGWRLVVHVIVAAVVVVGGTGLVSIGYPGGFVEIPMTLATALSMIFVIWMLNLYNFMDGMDGFAGGMAVVGFGVFAWFGVKSGAPLFAAFNLIVAAASAGFLLFNFPPARIFMGDTGSSMLGMLAAAFSLWGVDEQIFPIWIALLVFSPFIVDATVTLIRRMVRGEPVWQAHKTHYYQRLVRLGWSHRRTVLWEYAVMFACATTAVAVWRARSTWQWIALLGWIGVYVVLLLVITLWERQARPVDPANLQH